MLKMIEMLLEGWKRRAREAGAYDDYLIRNAGVIA